MTEPAAYGFLAGTFVGFAAGYVGSLMVLKRMALVGDALSHVALPGLALGILFNFNPFLGAFAFLFAAAILTWYIERTTRLFPESIVGVLFVTALAGALVIVPAAAVKNVSRSLSSYALLSGLAGIASAGSGILLADYLRLPAGPLVVTVGTAIFAGALVAGWIASRSSSTAPRS